MEDCFGCARKCKRIAIEDGASSAAAGSFKRMRIRDSRELVSTDYELQNSHSPEIYRECSLDFAAADSGLSFCSDHHSVASSRSSSSAESCEVVDEEKSSETEIESETESSTCINSKLSIRETTPAGHVYGEGDSDGMESRPEKQSTIHRKREPAAASKVSNAEIDDFFSASEKYEQQRFAEKYNFDIAKDVPLEGRYEWVRCQP